MNYKNILIIVILFLFTNCTTSNISMNKKNSVLKKNFSNKGFALVFDQKDYDDGIISKKINERSLVIFQKNLEIRTMVKITNMINNKSIIAQVGKDSKYPIFNNSVLSKRIADEIDLNIDEPYVEIIEISENSMFVAKKAKTFDQEKNVAKKAPVKSIDISDLNTIKINDKKKFEKKFSYEIKIADFFYGNTAKLMVDRIVNQTVVKNAKIKKINKEKYRVFLGPFNNINSLQKSYNDISILEFDNIEIIRND